MSCPGRSLMEVRVVVDVVRLVVPLSLFDWRSEGLLSPVIIVVMQYVNSE